MCPFCTSLTSIKYIDPYRKNTIKGRAIILLVGHMNNIHCFSSLPALKFIAESALLGSS
jgi:hypothetical protein